MSFDIDDSWNSGNDLVFAAGFCPCDMEYREYNRCWRIPADHAVRRLQKKIVHIDSFVVGKTARKGTGNHCRGSCFDDHAVGYCGERLYDICG